MPEDELEAFRVTLKRRGLTSAEGLALLTEVNRLRALATPAPAAGTTDDPAPKRAVQVTIEIGADTDADAIGSLRGIAHDYWDREIFGPCVSGSPSAGYTITVVRNPEMTHERYHAEINAWLERGHVHRAALSRNDGAAQP